MKAVVAAFNQEKALGAFSVIVQPVVEPMDRFAALPDTRGPNTNTLFLVKHMFCSTVKTDSSLMVLFQQLGGDNIHSRHWFRDVDKH